MNYPFHNQIKLHVEGRISAEDAKRQETTAKEILRRLQKQPGVILADEVGMGKTFVALAVAVSVALSNDRGDPVVVMVPPSLKEKWPADFDLFCERCLPKSLTEKLRSGRAERAVEFLKLLDDPPERKKSIIFVTHGAMSRSLGDKWVRLVLIYQALKNRRGTEQLKKVLKNVLAELLYMKWVERTGKHIWEELLATHPSKWLKILHKRGVDPEADNNRSNDDDPVPEAIWNILPEIDTKELFKILKEKIPQRRSKYFKEHLENARREINSHIRVLWDKCIRSLNLKLPLLILDEAHHLKNPGTRLSSLFQVQEAHSDAEEISKGPLAGVFERMLFLTATPFQLGHFELCSVLKRFEGVTWDKNGNDPMAERKTFLKEIEKLQKSLDSAQEAAVTLDNFWGNLRKDDLVLGDRKFEDVQGWWQEIRDGDGLTSNAKKVTTCFKRTFRRMREAETLLKPWVVRHCKPAYLPHPYDNKKRRCRFAGRAICDNTLSGHEEGIIVRDEALLPFLLAARATSCAPESRPVFAEGLASCYEAFLHTRRINKETISSITDGDDDSHSISGDHSDAMSWYLDSLEDLVEGVDVGTLLAHPKMSATVDQVVRIWESGEKVIVFCHYIATGRTLRQRISEAIDARIRNMGADILNCDSSDVPHIMERLGRRFFDDESPVRRACEREIVDVMKDFPQLKDKHEEELKEIILRYVRTPSFLVRFFPLKEDRLTDDDMIAAMDKPDLSGLTLRMMLKDFFEFLAKRCGTSDRTRYIEALKRTQVGSHSGRDLFASFAEDELQGDQTAKLLPNVRLVNGSTQTQTRQRLMLTFNTPFYPEVMIASSVMAEGVDLHLNCRHIIHHDLCWNPSTLEQRTGRIDRIGAKVEKCCGEPINIFLPFVAETQDEKMYRVVMDRERWFSVVMGQEYKLDVRTTDKISERIPFPDCAAQKLAFRLEVVCS